MTMISFSYSYFTFVAVLAAAHCKNLAIEDKVQVQVYYESLCPDSINFITTQLHPAYKTLGKERINLELIPWGKASENTVNGSTVFTCQHGPQECHGNKVHACAIDDATVETSTEFVYCSEKSDPPSDDSNLKKCAESVGISWSDLQECVSSGRADQLLSANGKKTALVKPVFIPTIVIDGKFSQENEDEALIKFKKLICDLIGSPSDECN